MASSLRKTDEGLELVLDGESLVESIRFDFEFWVVVRTGESTATLQFGSEVRYCSPKGPFQLNTETAETSSLAPLTALLRQRVCTAKIDRQSGVLSLTTVDGQSVESIPDPHYESWQLTTSHGDNFVGGPGDRVTKVATLPTD